MDDILVTGLGALSCLGSGADAFWRGMNDPRPAPRRVPDPLARMDLPLMYLVPEADLPDGPEECDGLPLGRGTQFAWEAARQAVADAGLGGADGLRGVDPRRVAVAISSGMGDSDLRERRRAVELAGAERTGAGPAARHERWLPDADARPAADRWLPAFPAASVVGGLLGARGPSTCLSNACAASGYALSVAADLIRCGEADVVVAGGTDAYSRVALGCFNRLGAVDPERCRPFAADRQGTVFGEGAAVLVLESAAHARRRGAGPGYARLAGAGWSCDAHHATAPEPGGEQIERAMRQALAQAGATGEEVGFVVPHGTGTALNDVVESRVLGSVLGAAAARTPVYSAKALVGHTGGAAGAFAALAAALVLHHRTVPANVPVGPLDPECALSLPDRAAPPTGPYGLVNAYAFGGNNVSLVLREAAR
ncbi:beta-ketoacyl-[acyl-carrier-protein] synthase family protein [Streptomyces sp. B1866]|uniref:beta-ketoacyl-[acyl-carrier-protein] synthase family protein n=1 Tax=Streptomyces sp. B1866 TaxID=3075431 RepID=UPI0028921943|nr:beta-ketoacyl-[acyl-carrier-protein] synthase family protein [Streptomyces sp. B1866]MDT3399148.1 beta-ketoacyl-[acyl-carrier-protein] synthase family protein [Streptomyces sp. B1866]